MSKNDSGKLFLALAMSAVLVAPTLSSAQDFRDWRHDRRERREDRWNDHRRNVRNEWRDLGVVSGVAGVAGLLSGNKTLAALGLGGGLYSAYRYEQDQRSIDRDARGRYELFRRPSFDYGGHHYVRHEEWRGGQRFYSFRRDR